MRAQYISKEQELTPKRSLEWPTLLMLVVCYGAWGVGAALFSTHPVVSIVLTAAAVAQYCSLQHEVIHGHPFRVQWLNEALVFPALSVFVSYLRFKDTHLQHHYDPSLTDPYDDPESNYMDPSIWARTSRGMRVLLRVNNTLAGRMFLGPLLGTYVFLRQDLIKALAKDRRVLQAYALHLAGLVPVLVGLAWLGMPFWAYLISVYFATALLKVRTFLEHRAHEFARARTVIVEDRGPFSYLFLNNNFHVVHHCMPTAPWYDLPALYAARREEYCRRNEAYVFRNYAQIFRSYFLRAKDPVPHPVWPVGKAPD
jgi:fatty acid desaturase